VFLFLLSSFFLPPAHKTPSFDLWCFPSLQFCGNHLHGLFPEPARVIWTPIFRYACGLSTCVSGILFYFVSKLNLFSCVTSAVFGLLGKVKKAMKTFVVRAQGYEAVHFQKQKQRSWSLPRLLDCRRGSTLSQLFRCVEFPKTWAVDPQGWRVKNSQVRAYRKRASSLVLEAEAEAFQAVSCSPWSSFPHLWK
jgi:hypothetical protein